MISYFLIAISFSVILLLISLFSWAVLAVGSIFGFCSVSSLDYFSNLTAALLLIVLLLAMLPAVIPLYI